MLANLECNILYNTIIKLNIISGFQKLIEICLLLWEPVSTKDPAPSLFKAM